MNIIFSNGGKQYQVKIGQIVRLEKINLKEGEEIKLNNILMIINKKNIQLGKPKISNNFIVGNVIKHGRHKKIKIIKFKRRKHYKKQQGHRQYFTDVKIINLCNIKKK